MPETTLPARDLKIDPSVNWKINMDDPIALQQLWKDLQALATKRPFEPDEVALMVDVTRRLRRTNTGPAKPRTTSRAKKASVDIKSLLMGD
jgi:hypothetical protein